MGDLQTIAIFLSCSVCLYLLLLFIKLLHKIWWTPIRINRLMSSQGIRGPPYRFIYGNTKEIRKMLTASMSRPMDVSHHILPRLQPHIHSWLNIYGKNFLIWSGPKAQLVVTEPEFVKEVLNNRENSYPKMDSVGYVKKLIGDGLATSDGEKWAKLRKLANHAFNGESLKNMVPAMIESVEMMLERWRHYEGKEIDVSAEFRLLTSEVISRTGFGSSYLEGKDIFEMLMKLGILTTRNVLNTWIPSLSRFWKSADERESEKLEQGIRDSIIRIIKKREMLMTEEGSFGTDLLGLLVKANHDADENNRITVEDVIDECKTFYIAGNETTATVLSWTAFLLAIHTNWQDQARKEVLELFGQQNPNPECFARMKTMNAIINESLRLYPAVTLIGRKVQRVVRFGMLILPKNINLGISTLAIHHDSQIWGEDAHLFKPERFSAGVAKATNNNPAVYLPFGLGPRNCVGMNFAATEVRIVLSMVLQRYAFTLSPTYVHSPAHVLSIHPEHGIQVMLHPL